MLSQRWRASFALVLFVLVALSMAQNQNVAALQRRADDADSSTPSTDDKATSTPTSDTSKDSSTPTSTPTTTSSTTSDTKTTPTTTTSTTETSSSSSPTPTSSSRSTSSEKTTSTTKKTSSSTKAPKKTTVTTPLVGKVTVKSKHTTAITTSGRVLTKVVETNKVVATTTGYKTSTNSPSLNGGDDNNDESGLSDTAKRIIGGIVGTVGGVMLLGGIAIVIWRIYGRKRHYNDMDDEGYASTDNSLHREKKRQSAIPFSSNNLDQYHAPNAKVNVGSNF